jgi:hypothetical protein
MSDGAQILIERFSDLSFTNVVQEIAIQVVGAPGQPGTGGDLTFRFVQSSPLAVWVVVHGLGKHPAIRVVDSAGSAVVGDYHDDSLNQSTLTFAGAFSGEAYFN